MSGILQLLTRVLLVSSCLVVLAPVHADGADWIEDRFLDAIQRIEEGSLDELVASVEPEERFAGMSLRGRLELLSISTNIVDLLALGEKSPLKGRVSPQQWDFLVKYQARIKQVAAIMHRSLYQSTFEALAGGDLDNSKVFVGSANLAMRDLPHADRLKWALQVFTATRLTALACEPSLLSLLLERSARPDLDPAARDAAMNLYILHGSTRASAAVHHARLLQALAH